jgi:hypothetical protein
MMLGLLTALLNDAGRRVAPTSSDPLLSVMCGRSTYKLTWEEIVRLYRLTLGPAAMNTRARYNVCPTTIIDTIIGHDASASSSRCGGAWCRRGGRSHSKN